MTEGGDPGRQINEFVLQSADDAGATSVVAGIRDQIEGCTGAMGEMFVDFSTFPDLPPSTIEEGFDAGGGADGAHIHVTVARKGDVVIVVESTGWADASLSTMNLALERARGSR